MARTNDEQATEVDFTVVSGPYRAHEEHRERKGWFFTGHYDASGDPLFYDRKFFARRRLVRRIANGYLIFFAVAFGLTMGSWFVMSALGHIR